VNWALLAKRVGKGEKGAGTRNDMAWVLKLVALGEKRRELGAVSKTGWKGREGCGDTKRHGLGAEAGGHWVRSDVNWVLLAKRVGKGERVRGRETTWPGR
jgi:hypothetical protein